MKYRHFLTRFICEQEYRAKARINTFEVRNLQKKGRTIEQECRGKKAGKAIEIPNEEKGGRFEKESRVTRRIWLPEFKRSKNFGRKSG